MFIDSTFKNVMLMKVYVLQGIHAGRDSPDCSEVVHRSNISRHRRQKHTLPAMPLLCRGVSLFDVAGQSAGDDSVEPTAVEPLAVASFSGNSESVCEYFTVTVRPAETDVSRHLLRSCPPEFP